MITAWLVAEGLSTVAGLPLTCFKGLELCKVLIKSYPSFLSLRLIDWQVVKVAFGPDQFKSFLSNNKAYTSANISANTNRPWFSQLSFYYSIGSQVAWKALRVTFLTSWWNWQSWNCLHITSPAQKHLCKLYTVNTKALRICSTSQSTLTWNFT